MMLSIRTGPSLAAAAFAVLSTQAALGQDKLLAVDWQNEEIRSFVRTRATTPLASVGADQEVTITSFVREFSGPDAYIECTMADAAGTTVATCLMIVAHVDARTRRATDWPPEHRALFFEDGE